MCCSSTSASTTYRWALQSAESWTTLLTLNVFWKQNVQPPRSYFQSHCLMAKHTRIEQYMTSEEVLNITGILTREAAGLPINDFIFRATTTLLSHPQEMTHDRTCDTLLSTTSSIFHKREKTPWSAMFATACTRFSRKSLSALSVKHRPL